jgi:hypothetical protein
MNRRDRLMATLRGEPVDRPPVCFYEISGREDTSGQDPFNVFSHPSWKPLLDLAREKTDRIIMCGLPFGDDPSKREAWKAMPELLTRTETSEDENGSRLTTYSLRAGQRLLTQCTRRDRDINTVWTIEHLLKDVEDFEAWLAIPERPVNGEALPERVLKLEREIGDTGIVMIDTCDPLCMVAPLFEMGTYTIIAMTETRLFHQALEKMARALYPRIEAVAKALPGRLWRIYGPEYASPPFLPPHLFEEYVVRYVRPMVEMIHRHCGYARIHAHGRLKDVLDSICATGCMGLDPIEPPNQGDVTLAYVRERYGKQLVLFGNLEITDIENLPTWQFEQKVRDALREGTQGSGRGFVLMPSACPYGRVLPELTLRNYEKMVECVLR